MILVFFSNSFLLRNWKHDLHVPFYQRWCLPMEGNSCSWWQGLPYVDCRKKRGANWVFKVAKLLCKILLHFKLVLSSNSPIVSANSQLKVVWCSSATCWWCKDLKSLALPLEPVLPPWVKSTNKINSLWKKNKLCYLHQRFYCKILM